MKVEKGFNMNGVDDWFDLDEADLIETFYSENEANDYISNI